MVENLATKLLRFLARFHLADSDEKKKEGREEPGPLLDWSSMGAQSLLVVDTVTNICIIMLS